MPVRPVVEQVFASVMVDLTDPNRRSKMRRILICQSLYSVDYLIISGRHADRAPMRDHNIRVAVCDLDALILALQKFRAGPLGRLALEHEANVNKI